MTIKKMFVLRPAKNKISGAYQKTQKKVPSNTQNKTHEKFVSNEANERTIIKYRPKKE